MFKSLSMHYFKLTKMLSPPQPLSLPPPPLPPSSLTPPCFSPSPHPPPPLTSLPLLLPSVIEALFAQISSPPSLQNYTALEHLRTLWGEVSKQSAIRQQYIQALDSTLDGVEVDRCQMVQLLHD